MVYPGRSGVSSLMLKGNCCSLPEVRMGPGVDWRMWTAAAMSPPANRRLCSPVAVPVWPRANSMTLARRWASVRGRASYSPLISSGGPFSPVSGRFSRIRRASRTTSPGDPVAGRLWSSPERVHWSVQPLSYQRFEPVGDRASFPVLAHCFSAPWFSAPCSSRKGLRRSRPRLGSPGQSLSKMTAQSGSLLLG